MGPGDDPRPAGDPDRRPAAAVWLLVVCSLAALVTIPALFMRDTADPAPDRAPSPGDEPAAPATVLARRAWDPDLPFKRFRSDGDGRVVIPAEAGDRIELRLPRDGSGTYSGQMRRGSAFDGLPPDASLDSEEGVFRWQPDEDDTGTRDFRFARGGGADTRYWDVRIILHPQGSGLVGPQVVIDSPEAGTTIEQPFGLRGWAVDLDDPEGTGIEQVEVWARRIGQPDRRLLGEAAYGAPRDDVASLHGERFRACGYHFVVEGLPVGTYDLEVVARSAAAGPIAPATVRVALR